MQIDLDHMQKGAKPQGTTPATMQATMQATAAAAASAKSIAAQANSQEAADADAVYSPGGFVHPLRAQEGEAAALSAAEEDKKERRKIERDAAIVGAFDKAPTMALAGDTHTHAHTHTHTHTHTHSE